MKQRSALGPMLRLAILALLAVSYVQSVSGSHSHS
ncbi:hypothetical protein CAEBREN_14537 [Caenorhabditis brenneri]|uniref:Uncharacterized protein n=1 Tax=Caenorhabditis brenneri TaxID=135651 RepID=G0MHJ6_CAEBE|nr:hypothetical protein CAEBREN_14537 [Caenorhabditis brenneri]